MSWPGAGKALEKSKAVKMSDLAALAGAVQPPMCR